jgi:F-type H+-transporting ATPase subunit delta
MSRSYAKAVFEVATESKTLQEWRTFLAKAALIAQDKETRKMFSNPMLDQDKILALFKSICGSLPTGAESFIKLLILKKRLGFLPNIAELFEKSYSLATKNVTVDVTTAAAASARQIETIRQALTRYFKQDMTLKFDVDAKILGGFVARSGDLVIDASVQHGLKELEKQLI